VVAEKGLLILDNQTVRNYSGLEIQAFIVHLYLCIKIHR